MQKNLYVLFWMSFYMFVEADFFLIITSYFPIEFLLCRFSSFCVQWFFPQPRMKNLASIFSMVSSAPPRVSGDLCVFDVSESHGRTCNIVCIHDKNKIFSV